MTVESIDLRRVGTALFVIVLHGLLILILLRETLHKTEKPAVTREIVLQLMRPPPPAAAPKPETPPPTTPILAPISPVIPAPGTSAPAPATNGASLRGLYFFLYECTPENFANLTEEERARCASASLSPNPDETNTLRNLPSRAKDAPAWNRALARKKNPSLLPCVSPQGFNPFGTAMCLGKAAAKGSFGNLDEAPGYGDTPSVVRDPSTGVPPISRAPQSPIESVGK
jgi:hypothetical protein